MTPRGCLPVSRGYIRVYNHYFQISSARETAWSINAKFHVEPPWEVGKKVHINGTGHMTKMATMSIYGKTFKNFFSITRSPMILKLSM